MRRGTRERRQKYSRLRGHDGRRAGGQAAAGFGCLVNLGSGAVGLPAGSSVLLASAPLADDGTVPADTAVWFSSGTQETPG